MSAEDEFDRPEFLLRVPAALGLARIDLTTSAARRDDAAVRWVLPAAGPRAVWGLPATRGGAELRPFVREYPELADLVGLPESIADIDRELAAALDPAVPVPGGAEPGRSTPVPPAQFDAAIASALANLREQVLVAVRIGRITEIPVVRGYVEDEHGLRQVFEEVWLDFGSFVTHSDARVDEWRLQQEWYRRRPAWVYRDGAVVPRRAPLDAQTSRLLRLPYGLFPRGMHRTLFASYLLHVAANLDLVKVSGPPPLARVDEDAARDLLSRPEQLSFQRSDVHERMRRDPAAALVDRALNGIHAFALGGGARPLEMILDFRKGQQRVDASADRRSRGTFLPTVRVLFTRSGAGLAVRQVTVDIDGRAWAATPAEAIWPQLLHVARGALMLAGEIDVHVMSHLLAEHVQVAMHAVLPESHPVRRLLESHLDGIDVINYAGDWLILGDEGVIAAATPLTSDDIAARAARALVRHYVHWRDFVPRAPLCDEDRYARAANVFWAALDPYVRGMLEGVPLDADLRAFFTTLTDHGPIGDGGGRPEVRATTHEELVQFCKFVVFHATFLHGWVNDAQWDDGGDPDLAPLAARALPDARLSYEAWAAAAAPLRSNAAFQMIIAHALTRFDVGLALRDDVHPSNPEAFRSMVRLLPPPFTDGPAADRRLHKDWIRSRLNS